MIGLHQPRETIEASTVRDGLRGELQSAFETSQLPEAPRAQDDLNRLLLKLRLAKS